jgi:hypothetical protein
MENFIENPETKKEHSPETPLPSTKKIFSLGFRCSSSAILKNLGLKEESFPFDWLISRLSVIRHCIEDNFQQFLNQNNYERRYSNTYEMMDSKNGFICDEHLMVNLFYQPADKMDIENTYQYYLAMNHHNIKEDKDFEYYSRCVDRFTNTLYDISILKTYIHITPLITTEKYEENQDTIIEECKEFDMFLYNKTNQTTKGIFFILVKNLELEHFTQSLIYHSLDTNTKIYLLNTNRHFIDAGEKFMGNSHYETEFIRDTINAVFSA